MVEFLFFSSVAAIPVAVSCDNVYYCETIRDSATFSLNLQQRLLVVTHNPALPL